ncbi:hypothetical protein [Thermoactinospora rubra]|uniref:hypothetical protein n=1 Tax=Thermoactinospora rubra TaxID=1088767 RepID=UPI001180953E|nr:hypothetical protein [Thermoactinospora rubra]
MSEVVPLPSFGEVFFDARGQERCLRVTWHEGTLVLSLWRGEMCTASFRMPIEDVGRLLDTLDEGYAEVTGGEPAAQPAGEPPVIPGTGQYNRPPENFPPAQPLTDERPTAAMAPSDVLVARGTPPPDKLVASFGETTAPRESYAAPQYTEPQYTERRPQYAEPVAAGAGDPVYQLPADQSQLRADPLGLGPQYQTSQQYGSAASYQDSYQGAQQYGSAPPYTGQHIAQPQEPAPAAAGLGTPMHGIPGAGRRRRQPNPVDPLLGLGTPQQPEPSITRPYVPDDMYVTGERLRPDQQRHDDPRW